jgi:hypothetical protein
MCIEFDGIQHFKPVDFFGGESSYKDTVKNDKIKDSFCKKEEIKVIK